MGELGRAYAGVRQRVNDLVRGTDAAARQTVAPATPAWTVHDLVAHVTGVAADITEGRLDGVATDPWTARQVASRRHRDTIDVLDEWNRCAPAIEDAMDGYGPAAFTLLADTVTHEHDLRGALDAPGARDSDAMALWWNACTHSGAAATGPALELEVETGTVVFGTEPPVATLRTTRFEVLRAMTGRRSLDQMRAFVRRGDFDVAMLLGERFTIRPDPLVE
jgi:uncharacterized protein (TIGR03083 family)